MAEAVNLTRSAQRKARGVPRRVTHKAGPNRVTGTTLQYLHTRKESLAVVVLVVYTRLDIERVYDTNGSLGYRQEAAERFLHRVLSNKHKGNKRDKSRIKVAKEEIISSRGAINEEMSILA